MKGLWPALGLFGVLNTLLAGGLVGYLAATDRLDQRRVHEVRALFKETLAERSAREGKEKADAEAGARADAAEARRTAPPVTTDERIESERASVRVEDQRLRRLRDEIELMRAALMQERELLDRQRIAFEKEQGLAVDQRRGRAELEQGVQFKKAVGVLQAVKPPEAKALLMGVLRDGLMPDAAAPTGSSPLTANAPAASAPAASAPQPPDAARLDMVVSYLNAMQERTRAKVIGEFLKDDPALASELLERLRRRGQIARAAEVPGR
ncbi:MAG: hypothetical protein FJ255_04595 [Phycisphaerae bacterium]|nr:hypothetical protein [Phycisphaerae bacterium]